MAMQAADRQNKRERGAQTGTRRAQRGVAWALQDWRTELDRLRGAYADRTLRGYASDLRVYESWCRQADLPMFSGRPEVLLRYLDEQLQGRAPNTIKRRLVALRRMHQLLGLADPLDDENVRLAVRRALRRNGRRPSQALGLGADLRDRLIAACPETTKGVRDRALIAVGYDVLARRSELVDLRAEDLVLLSRGAKILVRRAKTDQFAEGRYAYLSDPAFGHLQHWLKMARICPPGPLFRPVLNGRALPRPMHACGVNRALKEAAERAGLDSDAVRQLSGHSMRVGAAQDLVVAGRSLLQIMTAGRWTSINVLGSYARAADLNIWEQGSEGVL